MAFGLFVGLTTGNFVYQALTENHYDIAFERSFFQGLAIGLLVLLS